jgi:nitrite reductase (NADH) small subunit
MTATSTGTGSATRHVLVHVDELPVGEGVTFAVNGRQLAVFRLRSGAVRAISAVCPHQGGPLADGQADESVVICPLHAHVFDLATGECRTGQPPVETYPVTVDDAGHVIVEVPVT